MRVVSFPLVFLLFFFAGCVVVKGPLPQTSGRELGEKEARTVTDTLLRQAEAIQGMKGLARARIVKGDEKISLRYAVVFGIPDRLRIETFPVNGFYTLGLLTARGESLIALDTTEKVAVRGTAGIPLIRSATGIPADLAELMAVMTGRVVPERLNTLRDSGELNLVELPGGDIAVFSRDRGYYWRYSIETHQLKEMQTRDPFRGELNLQVTYQEYLGEGEGAVPRSLKIEIPREGTTVTLTLSSVSINPSLSSELFTQEIPSGYSIIERN